MDAFYIKVEKANAILRYRRLQKITTLFRFMELCIFLFILSRFSTQLPFSFKLSGDYFRGLSITILSPGFIFILGNAIVLVLLLKSGQFSAQEDSSSNSSIDVCNEYVENCEKGMNIYQEKEVSVPDLCGSKDRKMQRSKSEVLKRYQHEDSRPELRRMSTERCSYAEDEMSGEEFRRTVEAFIARQQRSLREEEFSAIVTLDHN